MDYHLMAKASMLFGEKPQLLLKSDQLGLFGTQHLTPKKPGDSSGSGTKKPAGGPFDVDPDKKITTGPRLTALVIRGSALLDLLKAEQMSMFGGKPETKKPKMKV